MIGSLLSIFLFLFVIQPLTELFPLDTVVHSVQLSMSAESVSGWGQELDSNPSFTTEFYFCDPCNSYLEKSIV